MIEPELASSVLHQSTYREHSARIGRFQTPDRARGNLFAPQRLNRYSYVRNDPVNRVDPKGLDDDIVVSSYEFLNDGGGGDGGGGSGDAGGDDGPPSIGPQGGDPGDPNSGPGSGPGCEPTSQIGCGGPSTYCDPSTDVTCGGGCDPTNVSCISGVTPPPAGLGVLPTSPIGVDGPVLGVGVINPNCVIACRVPCALLIEEPWFALLCFAACTQVCMN